ncbi:MAG: transcriptional regulator NrdR [Coriobacteriales bacterium]
MLCPNCSCKESRVIDSRSFDDGASIKRRRECLECGARFTTFERREEEPIMVLKRDGHVEPFDRSKLLKSLLSATAKRNVSLHTLEAFVDMVENDIRNTYRGPIPSSSLGDQVLIRLGDLDKVAYIRFASVYKDFKDIDELREELEHLTETAADAAVTADMQELEDE